MAGYIRLVFQGEINQEVNIETVNDELKNIAQVEHSRHRCFENFVVNMLGCCRILLLPKKLASMSIVKLINNRLSFDYNSLNLRYLLLFCLLFLDESLLARNGNSELFRQISFIT